MRHHAAQDAGQGRLRRRADRLRRLRQGLQGEQGDDRPLRQVERSSGPHDQGSCRSKSVKPAEGEEAVAVKAGDRILVDIFNDEKFVDVIGTSKGRGFAGVIRRHGFGGGPKSHGHMFQVQGSIGASSFPSRVFPGQRMPGHMGHAQITVRNLRIRGIDLEDNLSWSKAQFPARAMDTF